MFAQKAKYLTIMLVMILSAISFAGDRFPRPEFESGYEIPQNDLGIARDIAFYYMDVAMLFIALCVAAYFVFKKRSRRGVLGVMIFSIAYFGFFKKGCVCPIGSIQNITAGIFTEFRVSITVFLIFVLPILASLFFGRIFCSGVCPIGAIQDFLWLKPKKVPHKIAAILGFVPHLYLGVAILFAATGAGFPICRFDPFVGIFRLSAPFWTMALGAVFVALAIFFARPYCRFLCPYGLILKWTSAISKYRVNICADNNCVNCRLCESACPVDAIDAPTTDSAGEERKRSVERLKLYVSLMPLWIAAFVCAGWFLSVPFSKLHPDVRLYRIISQDALNTSGARSLESEGRRADANVIAILENRSDKAKYNFKIGLMILCGYFGFVIGAYLIRQSIYGKRKFHEANVKTCVTCARCYGYCPKTNREANV